MPVEPKKVGVIGCGNISGAYLKIQKQFPVLDVVAVADLDIERAKAKAEEFEIPRACGVEELLKDDSIEIVLNLTIPAVHAELDLAAIDAGKHVYVEKPLAISLEDGKKTLDAAAAKNLRVGCAPDTFLGAGHQTARKLIDDGWIGRPIAATAFMTGRGPEGWHPDPEFFYKVGGGPMFDMGPYYLTALIHLLGPVRRVSGSTQISFPQRTILSEKKFGQEMNVEVATHVAGVYDFASGAVATLVMSFDVVAATLPRIEIYGSEGTLFVPDPNGFGGDVFIQRMGGEKTKVPHTHMYPENTRSIGLADMATAMQTGRDHRASGALAYHVLECMHAVHTASDTGRYVELQSKLQRPAPLPMSMLPGRLDE